MRRIGLLAPLVVFALVPLTGSASSADPPTITGAPMVQIRAGSLQSLPTTVSGTISNYHQGETVTFHLGSVDGPVLASAVSPSPVPASGRADFLLTIPEGTPNGDHDIVAVGFKSQP